VGLDGLAASLYETVAGQLGPDGRMEVLLGHSPGDQGGRLDGRQR